MSPYEMVGVALFCIIGFSIYQAYKNEVRLSKDGQCTWIVEKAKLCPIARYLIGRKKK